MGRVIALVLLVLLVMGGPSHAANEWVGVASKLARSTVSVQELRTDEMGMQHLVTVCTAFSIDEQRGLFLSANHCVGELNRLDWQIAWLVYQNVPLDLAVFQSPGLRRPALKPRTAAIQAGLEIAMFGHAYGFEVPMLRIGHVSHPGMLIPPIKEAYPVLDASFMVTDIALIGGMSGGPMVDTDGNVISLNQMGNGVQGLGKPIDVILGATAGFWEGR